MGFVLILCVCVFVNLFVCSVCVSCFVRVYFFNVCVCGVNLL